MAVTYRIPKRHVEGFRFLVGLPLQKRNDLLYLIETSKVGQLPPDISKIASEKIGVGENEMELIVDALSSLLYALENYTGTKETFVKGIVNSFASQSEPEPFNQEEIIEFILSFLAKSYNLRISLKSSSLIYEREKIARGFRIVTDVRPVFDDESGKMLKGSVIIQSLRIDYFENNQHKKIILAIDTDDVQNLKKQIERSLDKVDSLRKVLGDSDLKEIKTQ